MKKNNSLRFIALGVFAVLWGYSGISYGYVEPVRPVLPNVTETGLTNPDLPNRKGVKENINWPFSTEDIGQITWHTALTTGVSIDPNIYLSSQDAAYDIVYADTASLGVDIPIQKNKLSMDYQATDYRYERFHVNDHLDQRVRGLLDIDLTDYRLTVSEVFRNFEELPGTSNTSRVKQDTNDLRAGITRQTDKFGFDVGYTNAVHHYNSDTPIFGSLTYRDRSSEKNIVDMSVGYKLWPKTSIALEDDYGVSEYKSLNSPDYYFNDILLGVKGEIFNKLSGSFQPGYRYQYFKESPIMFDGTYSGFICRGALKYSMTDKDVFDASLIRSIEDSTYQNVTYYAANFFGLSYTHVFTPKITSRVFGTYQRNGYPTETTEGAKTATRCDNAFGGGFTIRYNIQRWLSAEFGYEYKKARSNFRTFDYEDNITSFKITAGF
jgi:hypothetical protein